MKTRGIFGFYKYWFCLKEQVSFFERGITFLEEGGLGFLLFIRYHIYCGLLSFVYFFRGACLGGLEKCHFCLGNY